eukprot:TRINITY_DN3747_c0_g1_i1.p1 TRINITY_DN3747_c0_g1~~TRINITY_DN3747_c0_g1_i1.p1  ORF type:complete len:532 (-),score=261.68 TRINITY_DN3747_c0_g1_i1:75-1670(-)
MLSEPIIDYDNNNNNLIDKKFEKPILKPFQKHKPEYAAGIIVRIATLINFIFGIMIGALHQYILVYFQKREINIFYADPAKGYARIVSPSEAFFHRHVFGRASECFGRPICSTPGAWIDVMEREGCATWNNFTFTGKTRRVLNLGSYNYLGFAENTGSCIEQVIQTVKEQLNSTCSTRLTAGCTPLLIQLENKIAKFLGKEDAICIPMGFATNSTCIPSIVGPEDLVISDQLNHSSLVWGLRSSGATIKVFNHQDAKHLEQILQEAIMFGNVRTRKPYKKMVIIVEGIYSMEGEICRLPEFIELKKKYKAYLYVDEAHSIGALGPQGKGVCNYWGIDPNEVDILMGTFTKSFGSAGGYIAASRQLIQYIRANSFAACYDTSFSAGCIRQILASLSIILGEDGTDEGEKRLSALRNNSNYFRTRLIELGFVVLGDRDSPVIPILLYYPNKFLAFSKLCLELNIGVVVVGYPATDILLLRTRFCVSASHTIADLEEAIRSITKVGDLCLLRYNKHKFNRNKHRKTPSGVELEQ